MKNLVLIMIFVLTISDCYSQQNTKNTNNTQFSGSVLDFYKQYSLFTDPGEYAYLYKNLPDSLPELCKLIKAQFVHPYAELPQYRDQIPKERWNEMEKYPTVKSILAGLLSYDSRGLVNDRKPQNKLVLGCREYAIIMASVLKYRGIPARARYGHATYIMPGFHVSHVICEVWNEGSQRWMLVDPGMNLVDFSRDKFDFSNEAWLKLQKKEIDPDSFGIPGKYSGMVSIISKVTADLASILGNEYTTYQYPPLLDYAFENKNQMPEEYIDTLNRISELMNSLGNKSLSELLSIYNNTSKIQITKTFAPDIKTSGNVENNPDAINSSISKPTIEFANIPGGTYIMGSPLSEQGRQDDEVQHEVTLSAFQISKYLITVEQYNLFCDATGRKKPWYGLYGQAQMPVTQVTWDDAKAFAEWMGCRLPTEAEFEYAARANTTTPFYTGNCLTSEQANFNGNEPYSNCEKSENRKKPVTVGSFAPNDFGLYDMHGNMVEWCSDWYGPYNIDEKNNPKGPETGNIKVFRGGGFWHPAWKCRSACRNGDPTVHRGAGISFRIVRDE